MDDVLRLQLDHQLHGGARLQGNARRELQALKQGTLAFRPSRTRSA